MTTPGSPSDIHELLAASELTEVRIWEERARRLHEARDDAHPGEPELHITTAIASADGALHYRFRVLVDDHAARYVADIESVYALDGFVPEAVPEELRREFAEKVAFMATYAHARASILGSAGRLGLRAIVMPLVRLGEFKVGDPLPREKVQAMLADDAEDEAPGSD